MRRSISALLILTLAVSAAVAGPPEVWEPVGVGGGGGLWAPAWSPHNPDELYLACDMGEQFHSTDCGRSWRTVHFKRVRVEANSPPVQFTSDPDVLYMVNFLGERRTPSRSDDGGRTWAPLSADPTEAHALALLADPDRTDRLIVASRSGAWISQNGGAGFSEVVPAPENDLYVAGGVFADDLIVLCTKSGLLVSADGGETFARMEIGGIPSDEGIVSFAGARNDELIRFACVTLETKHVYPGVNGGSHEAFRNVYTLDWPGGRPAQDARWRRRSDGLPRGGNPFHVAMSRSNPEAILLGGGSRRGSAPIVFKSDDGGDSWQDILLTRGNRNIATGWSGSGGERDWGYGELVFGLAAHPRDADRFCFTDMGFVHVTTDGGALWRQAYCHPDTQNEPGRMIREGKPYRSAGLENTSVWHLAWADAETVWASFTDIRGLRSTDGGRSWAFDYDGFRMNTSYKVVLHPESGALYLAGSSIHDLYQSTYLTDRRIDKGSGDVFTSTDKGKTWRTLGEIGKPVVDVALDPTDPKRLYTSVVNSRSGGIYRCDDITAGSRARWTRLAPPPRTEGHPFNVKVLDDGAILCTFSGRRAGRPLKFTASSGVFLSADGGRTWADRSDPKMHYWTKDVVVDPHDPGQNTWYAGVFSGWGGPANNCGGLYMTTDRGRSWRKLFDSQRVTSCTINPDDPGEMYVTTEVDGLWHTGTLRAPEPTFSLVESYPFRQPERVFFNPHRPGEVWVTSFGNGLRVGRTPPAE